MYVPYTPLVHLPSLTAKRHPNKKFNKVDFPEFCGPSIEMTKILEFFDK